MNPFIKRLQVEGGFLDGLDLEFAPGLNVLIGPRGSGKTSIVELLRYCLDVSAVSDDLEVRSKEHAQSVMGMDGRITVTVQDGARETTISRSGAEDRPRRSGKYLPPRVFSQAEIERVGLEARGRLRIIDSIADPGEQVDRDEEAFESTIASLTVQLRELYADLEATKEQIASFSAVGDELREATKVQQSVLRSVKESEQRQKQLAELGKAAVLASTQYRQFESAHAEIERWRKEVLRALSRPAHLADWPNNAGVKDLLANVRANLGRVAAQFGTGVDLLTDTAARVDEAKLASQGQSLAIEDKARKLRRELEQLQAGAGSAAQRVAVLQERSAQLAGLETHKGELTTRIEQISSKRGVYLSQLEAIRNRHFAARAKVAKLLTKKLGPMIEVVVEQGGDAPGYVGAIQGALRGSGLHYNTLGPLLANAMSPRELVESAERGDVASIALLSGIPEERAIKAIQAITRAGAESIITAPIHDRVTMKLLDGAEYKPTTELSTGQRCTVVLSVLLSAEGRGLVVDQPEDHLDNAFVVSTLIEAIRQRKTETQLIFTTHNANIPVLADAELVVLLGSDGQRGFVRRAGPLADRQIVEAITSVMEGGYEAFELRAKFYRSSLRPTGR